MMLFVFGIKIYLVLSCGNISTLPKMGRMHIVKPEKHGLRIYHLIKYDTSYFDIYYRR